MCLRRRNRPMKEARQVCPECGAIWHEEQTCQDHQRRPAEAPGCIHGEEAGLPFWKASGFQSQPLCEIEEASAKERHSFCDPPSGGHFWTRETVEARRQSFCLEKHRERVPKSSDRIGAFDRHPRANQTKERQEGLEEAEESERYLFQVVVCRTPEHDCL